MLVDKEVLSARKLVYSTCVVQIFAFAVIGYVLSHLDSLEEPGAWEVRVFWWGGIMEPFFYPNDPDRNEYSLHIDETCCLFFVIRILSVTRGIVHGLRHIPQIIAPILMTVSLLKQCNPKGGQWIEWGQLAPVGVACLGLIHWLFYTTSSKLMWHERHRFKHINIRQRYDQPMMEYLQVLDRTFPNVDLPRWRSLYGETLPP